MNSASSSEGTTCTLNPELTLWQTALNPGPWSLSPCPLSLSPELTQRQPRHRPSSVSYMT